MSAAPTVEQPLLRGERQTFRAFPKDASAFLGDGVIFIFGLPRSGTSWLGKIFDSHPEVLYRHEPDMFLGEDRLPKHDPAPAQDPYLECARRYLERLARKPGSHAAGPPPYFPKPYRDPLRRLLWLAWLFAVRKIEGMPGGARWRGRIAVPDLVGGRGPPPGCFVLKSISSLGRTGVFADAWPNSRSIVILRHPCGQVGSMARGIARGKIPDPGAPAVLARSRRAETMGLKLEKLDELSPIEWLAWRWAFWNQTMLGDLAGRGNARIVKYEDLAADPEAVARDLFAFAGLAWDARTSAFLEASTNQDESRNYFGVIRDAPAAANRWREDLSAADQDRVLGIAGRVPAGRLFTP